MVKCCGFYFQLAVESSLLFSQSSLLVTFTLHKGYLIPINHKNPGNNTHQIRPIEHKNKSYHVLDIIWSDMLEEQRRKNIQEMLKK